jgi:hypothetical protein
MGNFDWEESRKPLSNPLNEKVIISRTLLHVHKGNIRVEYEVNKRPMGHIAHLSSLGQYRNIFFQYIKYAFHFYLPHPTLGGNYFNQLTFVLCQNVFM